MGLQMTLGCELQEGLNTSTSCLVRDLKVIQKVFKRSTITNVYYAKLVNERKL
jgi:hypothetical protein